MTDDLEKRMQEQIQQIRQKQDLTSAQKEKEIRKICCDTAKCSLGSEQPILLTDVLTHPFTYFQPGGFWEITRDIKPLIFAKMSFTEKVLANTKLNLTLAASFALWTMPHELLHAGVNKLTGGVNEEIVVNKIYGGDLWHALFPDIQSQLLFPLAGAYVKIAPTSLPAEFATTLAPYILTPIGIYLVQRSKEENKPYYWVLGAGLFGAHAGGVAGDFYQIGRRVTDGLTRIVYKDPQEMIKQEPVPQIDATVLWATVLGGFFLGNRIMSYTYRLSKGLVNSVRKMYEHK